MVEMMVYVRLRYGKADVLPGIVSLTVPVGSSAVAFFAGILEASVRAMQTELKHCSAIVLELEDLSGTKLTDDKVVELAKMASASNPLVLVVCAPSPTTKLDGNDIFGMDQFTTKEDFKAFKEVVLTKEDMKAMLTDIWKKRGIVLGTRT
eukprot:TRINITY_DN2414_c0_g1_i2.p1 TRINITY_DN2414_c0_g1~~TRINITY_DN2414_c0_g1_i2.p1  ORF type:complete len:150 (-),score=19.44 TRINITY_DN2414_c0_g1_i2:674-1123(-)